MNKQLFFIKTADSTASRVSVLTMIGVFGASVLIGIAEPRQASAALSVGSSYEQCQGNLNKADLATIRKQYKPSMDKRLEVIQSIKKNRLEWIRSSDAWLNKNNERKNSSTNSVRSDRNKALEAVNGTAKYPLHDKDDPRRQDTTNLDAITAKVTAAEQVVQNGVEATKNGSSKSKGQTVNAICKAVHEGAVYSQLIPYTRRESQNLAQTLIQQCTLQNIVDKAHAAKDVYEAKKQYAKDNKGVFDTDGSLGKRVDEVFAKAEKLSAEADAFSADVKKYDGTSYEEYKELNKRYNAIGEQVVGSPGWKGLAIKPTQDVYKEVMKTGVRKK